MAGEHFGDGGFGKHAGARGAVDAAVEQHVHETGKVGGGGFDAAGDARIRIAGEHELGVREAERRGEAIIKEIDVGVGSGDFGGGTGGLHRKSAVGEGAAGRAVRERRLADLEGGLAEGDERVQEHRRENVFAGEAGGVAERLADGDVAERGCVVFGKVVAEPAVEREASVAGIDDRHHECAAHRLAAAVAIGGAVEGPIAEGLVVKQLAVVEQADFEAGDGLIDVLAGEGAGGEGGEVGEVVGVEGGGKREKGHRENELHGVGAWCEHGAIVS